MTDRYDVTAIGNAIVDVISPASDDFLAAHGLAKGAMTLVGPEQSAALQGAMAQGVETSGGSAANTIAGIASFGGRAAFVGKVADDALGAAYKREIEAIGADFHTAGPVVGGPATGCCMINVTPDAQRTMATYLGAAGLVSPADIDPAVIEASAITYLEGYLFDPDDARRAFAKAAAIARTSKRMIALTLSDAFVVERHRAALLGFITEQVDLLFANEAELCALFETGFDEALYAVRPLTRIAAITRSEKGSVVCAGAELHEIAAEPIERLVDTTGAGDQYAAGFCFGLARSKSLADCGRLGSIAAAEVIQHYGPRPDQSLAGLAAKAGL
jgi:sugar/nucleoside kinase (ribokinase family)